MGQWWLRNVYDSAFDACFSCSTGSYVSDLVYLTRCASTNPRRGLVVLLSGQLWEGERGKRIIVGVLGLPVLPNLISSEKRAPPWRILIVEVCISGFRRHFFPFCWLYWTRRPTFALHSVYTSIHVMTRNNVKVVRGVRCS